MTTRTNLEVSTLDRDNFLYGTISCGVDTWSGIWNKGVLVFSCNHRLRSDNKVHRMSYSRTKWFKHPSFDFIVVRNTKNTSFQHPWIERLGVPSPR